MYIKRPILLAPTLAALLCPDSIHSPDIRQLLSADSIHSPDIRQPFLRTRYIRQTFANPFPRTRYIRSRSHSPTFAKMWLAFDTFARVIRHFGEFGASGHYLIVTYFNVQQMGPIKTDHNKWLKTLTLITLGCFHCNYFYPSRKFASCNYVNVISFFAPNCSHI